jgi:hypothetical protein
MDSLSENNANKLSDACKQEIGLGGSGGEGLAVSAAKGVFEQIDRPLDKNAMAVKVFPMTGTAGDAGIKAKVFIRISVDTSAVG